MSGPRPGRQRDSRLSINRGFSDDKDFMNAITKSPGRPFYGWYIVINSLLVNFMAVGTNFYAFNAFMEPLRDERGFSTTQINLALVIGTLFGVVAQVAYGAMVMRLGPRVMMSAGALVAGIAFALLGQVKGIGVFYLLYAVLFLGNAAQAGIVASTAVNNWFEAKRGKAIGLAAAGISLSGAVIPWAAMLLYKAYGLSAAFFIIGLGLVLIAPISFIVVRNRPEDHGLLPDGAEREPAPEGAAVPPEAPAGGEALIVSWPPGKLVREWAFWKAGLAFGLTMIGVVGVMVQLKPHFKSLEMGDNAAMGLMSLTALLGAAGKYAWGHSCDHFDSRKVAAVMMGANALGLGLGLIHGQAVALVLFILVFGFSMGGVMSVFQVIVADLFGRESFASVLRFAGLFLILQVVGYVAMGLAFDLTGSYAPAYALFMALDAVACVLAVSIKRPALRAAG